MVICGDRIAELRKARQSHICKACGAIIAKGTLYYSIIVGKGLGAIKFPQRIHRDCLERYQQEAPDGNKSSQDGK